MANQEHVAILRAGVPEWNKWRECNPTIRPNLRNAKFSKCDLSAVNFTGGLLRRINLNAANLTRADFTTADLAHSQLKGANLTHAIAAGTTFSSGTLVGAKFSNAELSGANFLQVDLSFSKFSAANLAGANLNGAKLRGADFTDANLSDANLAGVKANYARFRSARLTGANLAAARLIGADMTGANLTRARLIITNFGKAILAKATLRDAELNETIFTDVNLRGIDGLESCAHHGPSTIDYRTLAKSGKLPVEFLQGCGLSDEFINNLAIVFPTASHFHSCFISYSHADKRFARMLHRNLQAKGIRCWLDEKQMLPGDDFYEQIERGVSAWDKVILCCSKTSLRSWWVDNEIETAFAKERQLMREHGQKVRVLIPLDLDGYMFGDEWQSGKKQQILSRYVGDFSNWKEGEASCVAEIEKVTRSLALEDSGRETPPRQREPL
jgi:uncharacterized protein YjbI with pentapeptide repeats